MQEEGDGGRSLQGKGGARLRVEVGNGRGESILYGILEGGTKSSNSNDDISSRSFVLQSCKRSPALPIAPTASIDQKDATIKKWK